MLLTDTRLKHIKPSDRVLSLSDGRGTQLYCRIKPNGSKVFVFRYSHHGRASNLSLGQYPSVSLKTARAKAQEYKTMLANDINPMVHKTKHKQMRRNTFSQLANEWFFNKAASYSEIHQKQTLSRLNRFILPVFGTRQINTIETPEVITFLRQFEARGHFEQCHKVKSLLNQIFAYSLASGVCKVNPVMGVSAVLKPHKSQHLAFVREDKDISRLLEDIDQYNGNDTTQMALKLAPLVLLRPSELAGLEWSEFDFENKQLVIRADRMKMRRCHVVPLSHQALEIITQIQTYSGHGPYIFPNSKDSKKSINISTLRMALRSMGYNGSNKPKHDTHGFRHMGSTKLYELSATYNFTSEIIEKQLAHEERNKVKATYNHAEYLPERQRMMQLWADYLDQLKGSNVVPIKQIMQQANEGIL